MMKRTTHADEMNRCAHAAHAHDVSPGPSSPALLLQPTAAPHMPPHKMFPSFLDHLCGPSLSLSHSGLISFDGKMNVIISLPQKKSPRSVAHFQQRIAILSSFSICRRRSTSSGIAALRAIQPGGTASRSSIYSSARGPPTARRCRGQRVREAVLPSIGACPRPPAVRQSSRRLMLQDTRSLCG